MTLEQIEKICDKQGFWVNKDDNMFGNGKPGWEIGQMSSCGEDWFEVFEADDVDTFIANLENRIENWDSEEEAMPYIERRGRNGVPSSIRDLLDDADWKEEQLKDLLDAIKEAPDEEDELEENKKVTEAPEDDVDLENSDDVDKLANEVEPTAVDELIEEWEAKSPLHERVISEIVEDSEGYDGETLKERVLGRLGDIANGLVNGTVGSLIYYSDTVAFFDKYYDDIWDIIQDLVDNGLEPLESIKQHCDETEILMCSDTVKNWVAWMVYEEIAYMFGNELENVNE